MPAYAQLNQFMNLVRTANPTYERVASRTFGTIGTSSLRPLIAILGDHAGTAIQVANAIGQLPTVKVKRYLTPLYHLLATYPGLPPATADNLNMGALAQSNAALYQQTVMPANFTPTAPNPNNLRFVTPVSAFQNQTIEQYMLINRATTSVLLIHLSGVVGGMQTLFEGRSTIQHIVSSLRVARLLALPVCALTMDANADVCAPMQGEYAQLPNTTRVFVNDRHTGAHMPQFLNFVTARPNLVVMGFDAGICVFANVFGCTDILANGTFSPPLSTLANVVMSRATLVSTTPISSNTPTFGQAEYGPLFQT